MMKIKEEFDKLHIKSIASDQGQMKAPSCIGVSTGKASMEVSISIEGSLGKIKSGPLTSRVSRSCHLPGVQKVLLGSLQLKALSSHVLLRATLEGSPLLSQ